MNIKGVPRKLFFLAAYHFFAKKRLRSLDRVKMFGFDLEVPPSVFHPGLFFSSRILGEYVRQQSLKGKTVLDLGSGSGIQALIAASQGARVTAVDINSVAVDATRRNAERNSMPELKVVESDLFDQIPPTEEYDLIIVNPPFYKGVARDVAGHAWYSGSDLQYFRKLAPQARQHLGKHGKMIFVASSEMDIEGATSIFRESRFEVSQICSRKMLFEIFYILEISHVP